MSRFEIEIKSFLGDKTQADLLVLSMKKIDPGCKEVCRSKQLNHYFKDGDVNVLISAVENLFKKEEQENLREVIAKGKDFSVRSRQKDAEVLLVVKASLDGGTSANTVTRLEFEEPVKITLSELDELILNAGFSYEAKWSRDRVEYLYKDINVCLDKNAGYGYLAEFEIISAAEEQNTVIKEKLKNIMSELKVEELPQDRLARMFAFYNENWSDYYGTEKTFLID